MKNTDWENSETLRTRFVEEAGLTCAYYDSSNGIYVGNTKPANGALRCSDEDPADPNIDKGFSCSVGSNGSADCRVVDVANCIIKGDGGLFCDTLE